MRVQAQFKVVWEADPAQRAITLLLNGKVCSDSLPELEEHIAQARGSHEKVYIDLSEVTLVDRKTAQYFSRQAGRNVELVNCPNYLRRWIGQGSDNHEN